VTTEVVKLGELAHLDEKHVGILDRGGTNLTVSSFLAIARALNVPLAAPLEGV
jgi:hypothetical protein